MAATATCTIELENIAPPAQPARAKQRDSERLSETPRDALLGGNSLLSELGGSEPCPTPAIYALQKWNEPRENTYRVAATFWSLLVIGANDAAYGALIPYLERYYELSYIVVSLVFLSPFAGYVASALMNNYLHLRFGQRGVAIFSAGSHLAAYIIIANHPPYVALVFAFILAGFGNGVADAAWNAWIGNMANGSELLGFMHACYGVGGVISPLIATAMVAKANLEWFSFYYIMIAFAVVELGVLTWAFWDLDGESYRSVYKDNDIERETGLWDALFTLPAARVTWVASLFLLCYVGVEVALGGWIVVFMLNVRHAEQFASGMSAVGFWLGITIGRVVLAFVSPRVGVKLTTAACIGMTMALELVFWLVPEFYVSTVAVAFQGFFLGPLFPNVVVVASKLLPRHQHVVVIGFAAAFGGCGAAVLPFLTGILAQTSGVQVLQPIILSLLAVLLAIWLCLPKIEKRSE